MSSKPRAKTHRAICFTIYANIDKPLSLSKETLDKRIRYLVYQKEKCPDTGKLHWQGYAELQYPMSYSTFQNTLKDYGKFHCEARKGSREDARNYCMKKDTRVEDPWEFGKWNTRGQGNRTDLDKVIECVFTGKPLYDIAIEHPNEWIKFNRGITSLKAQWIEKEARKKGFRKVEVICSVGAAGMGKTRQALYNSDNTLKEDIYVLSRGNGNNLWFDGYQGEKTLVLDEFYSWITWDQLLRILDGHLHRIEYKGGSTYALWEKVYLTSNNPPDTWYPKIQKGKMLPQLERRISKYYVHTPTITYISTKWPGNTIQATFKDTFEIEIQEDEFDGMLSLD